MIHHPRCILIPGVNRADVTCRGNLDNGLRHEVKSANRLDKFRVDCWPNKSQNKKKKEPSAVNHIPHTKLSQLYSTEKTSDQSSVSSGVDREGTPSLTSLELDKESVAPWECARWAWESLFFFFFKHHCHRPHSSPGVPLSAFSVIFSIKDVE